jgi:hypothetical protein
MVGQLRRTANGRDARAGVRRRRDPLAAVARVGALLAVALGTACALVAPRTEPPARLRAWGDALASVRVQWADADGAVPLPAKGGVLLLGDDPYATDGAVVPPARRAELLAFVRGGGRLVLLGHAAHAAAELGIEPQWPERSAFRWGFDERAVEGAARLGFRVVSGKLPQLFDGVVPTADAAAAPDDGASVATIAGGTPCTAPLCAWSVGAPERGDVLARLAIERDGHVDTAGAPVVVHWQVGNGAVLACGVLPRLDHEEPAVRAAATAFVARCAAWAAGTGGVLALVPRAAPAAQPTPTPTRSAPLLAHWGWQLPQHAGGGEVDADELATAALLPSWAAGADLCAVELADGDGRMPLTWTSGDPLRPAPSFESRPPSSRWQPGTFSQLAAHARGRGMQTLGVLDPLPAGERAAERLATLRFVARELACVRRLGGGALDGIVLRDWLADDGGLTRAMLQDFQPAAALVGLGELAPAVATAARALDAGDGALRGLPFAGITASWRDGFAPQRFPLGVLDAHARWCGTNGGSTADWIVAQANDFVRSRQGLGAAMWWRRHDGDALDADTADYVHGVSLEPLRAAVAMPLAATGADGLRAAAATLVDGAPRGFAGRAEAPAAVHVLQNNWLRLHGSGGALQYDPRGEADFGAGALTLSPSLLRTRLFGGRPDGNALRSERIDLLANGRRGAGGYAAVARVAAGSGELQPPALLAADDAPAWPRAVVFEWRAQAGYHELELEPRAVKGRGVLTVELDGALLHALPFDAAVRRDAVTIPLHVARDGPRDLQLALLPAAASAGASLALDRLVLRRVGDVGVEANVVAAAGSRAVLAERSQSSYHAEVVELSTLADFPGLVLRLRCERAVRNLQAERVLCWPHHRTLAATGSGDDANVLRRPFVLRSADARLPDLVLAPLQLPRHESLRWLGDGQLAWRGAPETGLQAQLGVWLCAHGDGERWLPHAGPVLGAAAEPAALDLGGGAEAVLRSDVPLPWTRVVRVPGGAATPFLVRERGEWYWRGTQAGPDGDRWLRVWHWPGDTVAVAGGAQLLARTRPGPGALRLVALRDPQPLAVTVRVLQGSALTVPSVVLAADFDAVEVDGASWSWFDGRTVFLPNRAGTYRVVAKAPARRGAGAAPHVRATRAPLSACRWVPGSRELVLTTPVDPQRPAGLPWTAVLAGPRPVAIDNGEIVDDASLRLADAEAAAAVRAGGVLIRFGDGTCRVRYAQ